MKIRIVDFDKLTRNYINYREGVNKINLEKDNFLQEIEPIRKEMNSIISGMSGGLVLDNKSQEEKAIQFRTLQQELVSKEQDFKYKLKGWTDELNEKCYDELSDIITKWSLENSIDLVTGKMEVVFCNSNFEATDDILNILKEKNLFFEEEVIEEKEN
jgi:Skp family chaperone for outer membrane proteins